MGILKQIDSAGALPALEKMIRFAAGRHQLIAHNVANLETPGYQPLDVDPAAFQAQLAKAIDERRAGRGGTSGTLEIESTREVAMRRDGSLRLTPGTGSGNILFHDRNNRDLERTMQAMVENAGVFRMATDLYRHRSSVMRDAMAERVG